MLLYGNTSIVSDSSHTLIFSNINCTPLACILRLIWLHTANIDKGTLTVNGYRNKSLQAHHNVSVHTALIPSHHHDIFKLLSVTCHSHWLSSSTYTVRSI